MGAPGFGSHCVFEISCGVFPIVEWAAVRARSRANAAGRRPSRVSRHFQSQSGGQFWRSVRTPTAGVLAENPRSPPFGRIGPNGRIGVEVRKVGQKRLLHGLTTQWRLRDGRTQDYPQNGNEKPTNSTTNQRNVFLPRHLAKNYGHIDWEERLLKLRKLPKFAHRRRSHAPRTPRDVARGSPAAKSTNWDILVGHLASIRRSTEHSSIRPPLGLGWPQRAKNPRFGRWKVLAERRWSSREKPSRQR